MLVDNAVPAPEQIGSPPDVEFGHIGHGFVASSGPSDALAAANGNMTGSRSAFMVPQPVVCPAGAIGCSMRSAPSALLKTTPRRAGRRHMTLDLDDAERAALIEWLSETIACLSAHFFPARFRADVKPVGGST